MSQTPPPPADDDPTEDAPASPGPWTITDVLKTAVGGVVIAWVVVGMGPNLLMANSSVAGTWGDTFGGITALFSGLACAGIIALLWLHHVELRTHRSALQHLLEELQHRENR